MEWLSLLQAALQIKDAVQADLATGVSLDSAVKIITDKPLLDAVTKIGGTLFPNIKPELQAVAGVVAAFDYNGTKLLQNSINTLLVPSPNLTVDGIYGKATKAAVMALQTQLGNGLVVDGFAGKLTNAAITVALSKIKP